MAKWRGAAPNELARCRAAGMCVATLHRCTPLSCEAAACSNSACTPCSRFAWRHAWYCAIGQAMLKPLLPPPPPPPPGCGAAACTGWRRAAGARAALAHTAAAWPLSPIPVHPLPACAQRASQKPSRVSFRTPVPVSVGCSTSVCPGPPLTSHAAGPPGAWRSRPASRGPAPTCALHETFCRRALQLMSQLL